MKKTLILIITMMFLCSCSEEYKAKKFIDNLDSHSEYLFHKIDEASAYVYYEQNDVYYKYDIRKKEDVKIFQLDSEVHLYLCDNCHLGNGDVFYRDDMGSVFRHNLITNEESRLFNDKYVFMGCYNRHLMFFYKDYTGRLDTRFVDYNANTLESKNVDFYNIEEDYEKYFDMTAIVGYEGVLLIAQPSYMEDGQDFYNYIYHYNCIYDNGGRLNLLCETDDVRIGKVNEEMVILALTKDYEKRFAYDLHGKVVKEIYTLQGWEQYRGLTSGNIVAKSNHDNVLCYIANDDDAFISTIYLYYYDGDTGEEHKINSFTNAGKKVSFIVSSLAQQHIYVKSDRSGLVFYGETDFLNEYTLFSFDFESRTIQAIDRGKDITFTRDRFKITHHNGSESWYDTDGQESAPRSSAYEYGARFADEVNDLLDFWGLF